MRRTGRLRRIAVIAAAAGALALGSAAMTEGPAAHAATTAATVHAAPAAAALPAGISYGTVYHIYYNSYDINAWSDGPEVAAYQGSAAQDDFAVVQNVNAPSYVNLIYDGPGNASGQCVGDEDNQSGNYNAWLPGSCAPGASLPWGANMTLVSAGCPSGQYAFLDAHSGGYVAFSAYSNGSLVILNGGAVCFKFAVA